MRSKPLRRARRAYELAHVFAALRACAVALLVMSLAIHRYPVANWMIVVAVLVLTAVATNSWRGGARQRGSLVGLAAALPVTALPAAAVAAPQSIACFVAGGLGGLAIATIAASDRDPSRFMVAASIVAIPAGLLGCGSLGLMAGIVAGAGLASTMARV